MAFALRNLYTDGFADQFGGPKGKKYKFKQLQETICELTSKPGTEQKNILCCCVPKLEGLARTDR